MDEKPTVWVDTSQTLGDTNNCLAVANALHPNPKKFEDGDELGGMKADIGITTRAYVSVPARFGVTLQMPDNTLDLPHKSFDFQIAFSHHRNQPTTRSRAFDATKVHFYETVPTRVNAASLNKARAQWEGLLKPYTKNHPVYMFIVNRELDLSQVDEIRATVERTGGSLLVTTSAKTSEELSAAVHARLNGMKSLYFYDLKKEAKHNPYQAMLAMADKIIVSPDSFSLPSDVLATGKPAYFVIKGADSNAPLVEQIEKMNSYDGRIPYFGPLIQQGYFRSLSRLSEDVSKEPLRPINSADQIAADILKARAEKLAQSPPQQAPTDKPWTERTQGSAWNHVHSF